MPPATRRGDRGGDVAWAGGSLELRAESRELRHRFRKTASCIQLQTVSSQLHHHTVSTVDFPSDPAGLDSRLMISGAKAIACVEGDLGRPLGAVPAVPRMNGRRAVCGMMPVG